MANDGKIYITISDRRGGSGSGVGDQPDEGNKKESTAAKYIRHRFFSFAEAQAKQFVNYSVGNIGNFTGSYQAQRDAEQAMSALNWLISTGTTAYTVAKTGAGWIGAAVAVAISVGSGLINAGYREYTEQFQNRKDNRNIEMMRNRLGLQGLTDGSRTGGY